MNGHQRGWCVSATWWARGYFPLASMPTAGWPFLADLLEGQGPSSPLWSPSPWSICLESVLKLGQEKPAQTLSSFYAS